MTTRFLAFLAGAVLLLTGCSRPTPIIVGSKDTIENNILAEIVAQHLEHRLGRPVQRQFNLGDIRIVHQALIGGTVSLYPEYSGQIVTEILKEPASPDNTVVYERARLEMKRMSLLEFMPSLGFDSRTALVVASAGNEILGSASDAVAIGTRWRVGVTFEFQNRNSGVPLLNKYSLAMGAPFRAMKPTELFKAMTEGTITMAVATTSDGHLTLPRWKALSDDKNVFPAGEPGILVREDVLAAEPNLRAALHSLSGKITLDQMRQMNADVEIKEKLVADVATEFLRSAGLIQ
jgi:glycine betaine/choline ABC-type transport system substrate-binding protein